MPMEGHWQRVNTPLRRLTERERNVAFAGIAVTLVAMIALLVATIGDSRPGPAPGCIYSLVPGVMGSQPFQACGKRAERACAHHASMSDPGSESITEACRRAGIVG